MSKDVQMIRPPVVMNGCEDGLERFMYDYLVGLFDEDAKPLSIEATETLRVHRLLTWREYSVDIVQLGAGVRVAGHVGACDTVELDLFAHTDRALDGFPLPAPARFLGLGAVRIAAGVRCDRAAGPTGAAWLSFRAWPSAEAALSGDALPEIGAALTAPGEATA